MKNINILLTIFISLLTFLALTANAETGRLMAEDWPVLEVFRELELRGEVPIQRNVWPDRSGKILEDLPNDPSGEAARFWTEELRRALSNVEIAADTVLLIAEPGVWGILNTPRDTDDRLYPILRLGGGMKKGPLDGFVSYVVNMRWAKEDNYRGRQWEGFAGRPDQVYLRMDGEDWGVQFGKDHISWAEGLVIGRVHDPFERLDYELKVGPFALCGFASFLDPLSIQEPSGDSTVVRWANRYLSGHRLEFMSPHLTIALYETMLYGGVGRAPEIIYLVPLYWFHSEQLNRGLDDNTIIGGDFQALFPPVRLSFEFMVDDIQVESAIQSDEEPPEIGIAGQLDWGATVFKKWLTISARYEGVTNWTYNQHKPWNRYIFMDTPLGSELGNDADRTSLSAQLYTGPWAIIGTRAFFHRKGEGDIYADWTEPWMDVDGAYSEPFPTGIVQETLGFNLDWKGYYNRYGFWKIGFEYGNVSNAEHVSKKKCDYWKLVVELTGSLNLRIDI